MLPFQRYAASFHLLCMATCAVLISVTAVAQEIIYLAPDLYTPRQKGSATDALQAERLIHDAAAAAQQGEPSHALRLAAKALSRDPDNLVARRVLGYERHGDRWLTPYQKRKLDRGFVWHVDFGWVKQKDLPRYQQGERRIGRRWVSIEQDSERPAPVDHVWQVRTDHFLVTTTHSLEAAAHLAAELERLFQAWRQLFAGYYLGDAEVQARFDGTRTARGRSKPFNVIFHKSKQQYVAALKHKQPRIADTLGIYFDDLRQAHFFAASEAKTNILSDDLRATLYHESVHQLFQESMRSKRGVGRDHGFWVVEAVACYFETLQPNDHGFQSGSPDSGRLPAAHRRLLVDNYYVPLEELASLGQSDLQRRSDLAPLYSQMSGLAAYLMHGQQGQLREPLVAHLKALYQGKAGPADLFERLGKSPGDLDAGYRRYLSELAAPGNGG